MNGTDILSQAAANGGLTFIWAISIGQLITIGLALIGIVGGALGFIIEVKKQGKALIFLTGQVHKLNEELVTQRREQHEEQMKIRSEILQMRSDQHQKLGDMLTGLYFVREQLKKDDAA